MADLEASSAAAKENAAALGARLADLGARRAETAAAASGLAAKAAQADHVKGVLHPRAGFELSLYLYLTHLHWNDAERAAMAAAQAAAKPDADPTAPALPPPDPDRVRAIIADPFKQAPGGGGNGGGGVFGGGTGAAGFPGLGHDMYPIDLDTRGMSPVQVAHELWRLIEEKTL